MNTSRSCSERRSHVGSKAARIVRWRGSTLRAGVSRMSDYARFRRQSLRTRAPAPSSPPVRSPAASRRPDGRCGPRQGAVRRSVETGLHPARVLHEQFDGAVAFRLSASSRAPDRSARRRRAPILRQIEPFARGDEHPTSGAAPESPRAGSRRRADARSCPAPAASDFSRR